MKLFSRQRLHDRFTNGESLGLFTEALEYFQSYHREPDSKKLASAAQRLELCRARYPNDLLPLFYLGLVRVEQSYPGLDEAIELFKRVSESTDEATLRLDALYNLGIANIELYDPNATVRAREILTEAIEIATKIGTSRSKAVELHARILLVYLDAESLQKEGAIEELRSKAEKAEAKLQELRKSLPNGDLPETARDYIHAEYWNTMGLMANFRSRSAASEDERLTRRQESADHFEKALRYKKNWIPSLSNLAALYQHQFDDREKARSLWDKVLKIRPDDQYAHYQLGKLFEKNDPPHARQHYEKAPTIREAREALEALNQNEQSLKDNEASGEAPEPR